MKLPKFKADGTIVHNGKEYISIQELAQKLTELGIPHEMRKAMDGYQICVPNCKGEWEGDAVEHFASYGAEEDLIEVFGFGLEDPVGWLTVDKALKYFVKWNKERSGK